MSNRHRFVGGALAALLLCNVPPLAAQSMEELERRLTIVERKLSSEALTQIVNELNQLQSESSELRGRLDVVQRQLEQLEERQRQIYADLDSRLRALESGPPPVVPGQTPGGPTVPGQAPGDQAVPGQGPDQGFGTPGNVPPPLPPATGGEAGAPTGPAAGQPQPPAPQEPAAPPLQDPRSEAEQYRAAFETLRAGNYDDAADQFQAFLRRFPEGEFSANARYWLGESYYVVREFDTALMHFQRVLEDYPESAKAGDALLKIGFVQFELGQLNQARETLRRVVNEYPGTTAASLASQRLERIGG